MGHIVDRWELKVQDKNICGLKEKSPPRCEKDLRSFLGTCNVYRRLVKEQAQVAWQMAAMTSSKGPDRWGMLSDEALGAFEELKRRLTEAPILALPRRQGAFLLDTDASAGQVGEILLQEQPDQSTRLVSYWSRSLNAADQNCSTTERGYLAVVWAPFLLRPYIKGTRFTVRTDHAALKWMFHMDGGHGRLARCRLRWAELNDVVQTGRRAAHHAEDTMSRISTPARDE